MRTTESFSSLVGMLVVISSGASVMDNNQTLIS